MTRKITFIYFAFAPVLFGLSWFISHRVLPRAQALGSGKISQTDNKIGFIYASFLTGLYLVAYFVWRDLYRKKK